MTREIQTDRRWLRSVIAASAEPLPAFPWMRGERRRPETLAIAAPAEPVPVAGARWFPLFGALRSVAAH